MIDKLSEIGLVQNDWIVDTKAHPPIFQVPPPYFYLVLCYAMLCYVFSCYVVLRYVTLCYIMLYCIMSWDVLWCDMTWRDIIWYDYHWGESKIFVFFLYLLKYFYLIIISSEKYLKKNSVLIFIKFPLFRSEWISFSFY